MSIAKTLRDRFGSEEDFVERKLLIGSSFITLIGFRTLVDFTRTLSMIREQIVPEGFTEATAKKIMTGLGNDLADQTLDKTITEMLDGMLIAIHEASGACVGICPVPIAVTRAIDTPKTENSLRGSNSGFNEDAETNIGLLRKQMISTELRTESYFCGQATKSRIVLAYMDNRIPKKLLASVKSALEKGKDKEIACLQDLSKVLGLSDISVLSRYNSSELPQNAARALKKGRAVLFLDRMPFALIFPNLISDMFVTEDDRNYPWIIAYALRSLRLLGMFLTVVIPGLYVALVSVNPDVLRFELAQSIAKSRIEVPYPAFVETLMLLIILELSLEAIVRLPSSIGPTVTMVGGIVLGEAVVTAKLVSSLLIIVLATVTISNSVVVGHENSLSVRLFKYLLLVLSAVFGVLGLLAGLVLICSHLGGIKTLGVPFMQWEKAEVE